MCLEKNRSKADLPDEINQPSWYNQGGIQPLDYIEANNLGHHEASIIQYLTRAGRKGVRLDDLLKAEFYIKRLVKLEKAKLAALHNERPHFLKDTNPLRPCGTDHGGEESTDKVHVITVDKKAIHVPARSELTSVKDIKLLAKVLLAYDLVEVIEGDLVRLLDVTQIALKGGEEFISQPKVGVGN